MRSIIGLFNWKNIIQYTVVGEPGSYYLTHFSPEDGKGRTIAQKLFDSFSGTELEGKLAIVGTDGTASMTGKHNGCIRSLEELLHRPLQCVYYTQMNFPCDMCLLLWMGQQVVQIHLPDQ